MIRYYFSVRVGSRLIPDREGVELPPGSDPAVYARYLAKELRTDPMLAAVSLNGCAIEVSDGLGRTRIREMVAGAPGAWGMP